MLAIKSAQYRPLLRVWWPELGDILQHRFRPHLHLFSVAVSLGHSMDHWRFFVEWRFFGDVVVWLWCSRTVASYHRFLSGSSSTGDLLLVSSSLGLCFEGKVKSWVDLPRFRLIGGWTGVRSSWWGQHQGSKFWLLFHPCSRSAHFCGYFPSSSLD